MNTLQAFFASLAEPARLALVGASFIAGALVLRKLLLPGQHALVDSAAKPAGGAASKKPVTV